MTDSEWDAFKSENDLSRFGFTQPTEWYTTRTAGDWFQTLEIDNSDAVYCVAAVLHLITPQWEKNQPSDSVPLRAVDAAVKNTDSPGGDFKKHVATLAKGCTASRKKSLGYEHRIAEAARAFANAAIVDDDKRQIRGLAEALARIEEHILYKHAVKGEHRKAEDTRRRMLKAFVCQLHTLQP